MKKRRTFFYTMLAAGLLASCTNDELADNPLADGPVPLSVTADISQVATRATATAFEDGDQIGIFPIKNNELEIGQANKPYTYSGSAFASTDPYYFQDRGMVTFNAYYPYDATLTATAHTIDIDTRAANQTPQQVAGHNWRKNDYLFASAATEVTTASVSYTFKHVMSQVVLVFKAGTDDGVANLSALSEYKIATPLVMNGSFDVVTGAVTLDDGATAETIEMTVTGSAATELRADPLILLPQSISGGRLNIDVTYNSETYKAEIDAPANGLQPGHSYVYTVTIKNNGLSVRYTEIENWITETDEGDATLQQ